MAVRKKNHNKIIDDAYKVSKWLEEYSTIMSSRQKLGWFNQEPRHKPFSLWDKTKITCFAFMSGGLMSGLAYGNGQILSAFVKPDYSAEIAAGGFLFGLFCAPRDIKYGPSAFGAHILTHGFCLAAAPVVSKASQLVQAWAQSKDPRIAYNDKHGQTILPPSVSLPKTYMIDVTPR